MSKRVEKELNNSKKTPEDLANSPSAESKETKSKMKEKESEENISEPKLEKDKVEIWVENELRPRINELFDIRKTGNGRYDWPPSRTNRTLSIIYKNQHDSKPLKTPKIYLVEPSQELINKFSLNKEENTNYYYGINTENNDNWQNAFNLINSYLQEVQTNNPKKEIEILKEKNLRSLADLNNQAKIHAKEINEIIKYSNERFLQQLLFFPDNYERALQASQNDPDPKIQNFLTGFRMVLTEFQNFLKKEGVEEIKITPQKDIFNGELHETLEEPEENNDFPEETILQVFRKGYQIHQRVLRKATVKVSKRKEIESKKKE